MPPQIKIGLIIDEFFGGANTAFGGFGFAARRYITKYIPDENIQIDVLLGKGNSHFRAEHYREDNVNLYRLPRRSHFAGKWLKEQNYDLYLSLELVNDFVLKNEKDPRKKLILWIRDPRPKYEWDEINTLKLLPETPYYNQDIYELVHALNNQGRVIFISQAHFLDQKARDLYKLPLHTPIGYLPNPMAVDAHAEQYLGTKKDNIIFLGRIDGVKRPWLFCEIANCLPEYNFYILGKAFWEKEKNEKIMERYINVPNLHFAGHVDGEEKEQYLREAKILVNTSIHEALPVSFTEALAHGTLLVSNRNPDELASRFGVWVGDVLGDGFEAVDKFVMAIKSLIEDDNLRQQKARDAIAYVRAIHDVSNFVADLKAIIYQAVR